MGPRGRRLAAGLTVLAGLLFAGRWTSEFLADQWWAGSVSPSVGLLLTRRALLGLALDGAGVLVATAWFLLQVRLLWRAVGELGPRERGGNPVVRRALQAPQARAVALLVALLLGLLIGSGPSSWTDGVLLARAGVRYGVPDPALGIDLGFFIAWLPLWLRLQAFTTALVLTALGLVAFLLILSGAIRIGRGRLAITDSGRRHLGLLLVLLALVVGASKVLEPYELAAGIPTALTTGVIRLHRSVGMVLVGMSLAVAALSFTWSRRPVHTLVAGGWFALSGALVLANWLVPATRPDPRDPEHIASRNQSELLAFAIDVHSTSRLADAGWPHSLAGEPIARLVPEGTLVGSPARVAWGDSGVARPAWGMVVRDAGGSLRFRMIREDSVGNAGEPVPIPPGEGDLALPPHASVPGAPPVAVGQGGGLPVGGPGRRLALAWALQDWSLLAAPAEARIDWYLDPVARLGHAAPFAEWRGVRPWVDGPRLSWVVNGYVLAEAFPVIRRVEWQGRRVALVRAGFLGVVDAATGALRIYLRPGSDSLAHAWARATDDLVRPASELPEPLLRSLWYPEALLELQARILADRASAGRPGQVVALGGTGAGPAPDAASVPLVDSGADQLYALVIGRTVSGMDELIQLLPDSAGAVEPPAVVSRRLGRMPLIQELGDSVTAAGGTWLRDSLRLAPTAQGILAYQPFWSVNRGGQARLVAVGMARGDRLAVGRTPGEAQVRLATGTATRQGLASDETLLEAARRLADEADSALRQGDLEGFGRLFTRLKALLQGGSEPPR